VICLIYLISQVKTGLSALALMRQLGVSYPTTWLVYQKLMQAMPERDVQYTLGGELSGGKSGRGSKNKVPFVNAGIQTLEFGLLKIFRKLRRGCTDTTAKI
jgi:hypothetical protein